MGLESKGWVGGAGEQGVGGAEEQGVGEAGLQMIGGAGKLWNKGWRRGDWWS